MNKNTKKIISKEILIFLSVLILSVLFFLGLYAYNYRQNSEIIRLTDNIKFKEKEANNLNIDFDYKQRNQQWFFEKMSNYYSNIGENKYINSKDVLWKYFTDNFEKETLETWNTISEVNKNNVYLDKVYFSSLEELKYFITSKSFSEKDISNNQKAKEILNEVRVLNVDLAALYKSLIPLDKQRNFSINLLFVLLCVFFVMRYLFYLIKWCFKNLRE